MDASTGELLTTATAARELGLSNGYTRVLFDKGKLRGLVIQRGLYTLNLVSRESVEELKAERLANPPQHGPQKQAAKAGK